MSLDTPDRATGAKNGEGEPAARFGHASWLAPAACVALSLVVSLAENLSGTDRLATLAFDSRHYLESTRQVQAILSALISGGAQPVAVSPWFADFLLLDGPILPLVGALAFLVCGQVPAATHWPVFVVEQCLIQAVGVLLLYKLAARLTGSRVWAFAAAAAWALYPPAIVAAGRFLTETLTTVLLISLVLIVTAAPDTSLSCLRFLASGVVAGLTFLFKPASLPCIALALLTGILTRERRREKFIASASIAAGILLPLAAWMLVSSALTGRPYLIPQREPVRNMAKGCDFLADGWSALPTPPLTARYAELATPTAVLASAMKDHPAETIMLFARKIPRIFFVPWNDFRKTVLSLTPQTQLALNGALWALAIAGLLAFFTDRHGLLVEGKTAMWASGCASLFVIAGHMAYLLFEGIARYGFTCVPFAIAFAAYLGQRLSSSRPHPARLVALAGTLAVSCLFFLADAIPYLLAAGFTYEQARIFIAAQRVFWLFWSAKTAWAVLMPPKRTASLLAAAAFAGVPALGTVSVIAHLAGPDYEREWAAALNPGEAVELSIALPAGAADVKSAFLFLDGDALDGIRASINAKDLDAAPDSLNRFSAERYLMFNLMLTYSYLDAVPLDRMRQWRVIPLPVSLLRFGKENALRLTNRGTKRSTVYGDYRGQAPLLPGWDRFSPGRLCTSMSGHEGRLCERLSHRPPKAACALIGGGGEDPADLSPSPGLQSGRFRAFIALGRAASPQASGHASPGSAGQAFTRELGAADFDPLMRWQEGKETTVRINRRILRAARSTAAAVDLPAQLSGSPFLRVNVSGQCLSAGRPGPLGLLCVITGAGKKPYTMVLPSTPASIHADGRWRPFSFGETVPAGALGGRLQSIQLALFPGPWWQVSEYGPARRAPDTMVKDLKVEVAAEERVPLDGLSLTLY